MKKTIYFALAMLTLASCTEEYEYSAPATDNSGIFFADDEYSEWVFGPDQPQTFTFIVTRRDSTEARTYRLLSDDSEMNIPSEVQFAAGQGKATVTATATLTPPTFRRDVTIMAAEGDRYTYGNPELTLTVSVANNVIDCQKETYSNNYTKEPVTVYDFGTKVADGREVTTYGAADFLCDGYMLMFTLDSEGEAEVEMQEALYAVPYISGITEKYYQSVAGIGSYTAGAVEFNLKYYISGMNLYDINGEKITFPTDYNPLPGSEASE